MLHLRLHLGLLLRRTDLKALFLPWLLALHLRLYLRLHLRRRALQLLEAAFLIALHWRRLAAGPVLAGLVAGTFFSVGLTLAGWPRLGGVHVGVVGCIVNVVVAVAFSAGPSIGGRGASTAGGWRGGPPADRV